MSGWRLRSAISGRRSLALVTALVASGILLAAPAKGHTPPAPPLTAAQAWPRAHAASTPSDLPDGTPYQPAVFLTVGDSVGTAPTHDGKYLRVVERRSDGTVRQLRRLPVALGLTLPAVTVAGGLLIWVESTAHRLELWSLNLAGSHPPQRITADLGDARFYQSQYDLVVAEGRVHWVAAGPHNDTEVRSVALGGGSVDVRDEPGEWALSAWPWLVNGVTAGGGATTLRNIITGSAQAVPTSKHGVTACSPDWCQMVSFTKDGDAHIEVMHPDGGARRTAAVGATTTVIADVVVLDRFEVVSQQTATSDLTGDIQLLVYDVKTRSTIEISPDAFDVSYEAGVLWWSSGIQQTQSFLRHALDLRTV